jgi:hypothetical protein
VGVFQSPTAYPDVPSTHAGESNRPLKLLTWRQTVDILPRPLLNLLFDVRFQLEAQEGSTAVVDERTDDEKARTLKSPEAPERCGAGIRTSTAGCRTTASPPRTCHPTQQGCISTTPTPRGAAQDRRRRPR